MIDIIIMIVCVIGSVTFAVNAAKVGSFSSMLLWIIIGTLELIATILKVIQVFA